MKLRQRFLHVPVILAALALHPGPAFGQTVIGPSGQAPQNILLAAPMSGPLGFLGEEARRGAELALKTWGGHGLLLVDEHQAETVPPSLAQVPVIVGYFFESRLTADSPRYLFAGKPVILPFLTNPQAAAIGPKTYFKFMADDRQQGRFLALSVLEQRRRPRRLLLLSGPEEPARTVAASFVETLYNPPPPPGAKKAKTPPPPKPYDKKSTLIQQELTDPEDLAALNFDDQTRPDLVVLAVNPDLAQAVAPWFKKHLAKTTIYAPSHLALREVGAAYASLDLKLSLSLPLNMGDGKNNNLNTFKEKYLSRHHQRPTWAAALAYDALGLAIKAAGTENPLEYLSQPDQSYQFLGQYPVSPGPETIPPLTLMPVTNETRVFLP